MPYIIQRERERLDPTIDALILLLGTADRGSFGRLNYVITRLIVHFWHVAPHYYRVAGISGVLSNVQTEFYRRCVVPYEDVKITENGDLPEFTFLSETQKE